MVFVFCTLSHGTMYLCKVSLNHLQQFSSYTAVYDRNHYLQSSICNSIKVGKPELWFLFSAHCLILFYISVKFYENISNVFQVMEWARFCDGHTDKLWEKQYVSPLCKKKT